MFALMYCTIIRKQQPEEGPGFKRRVFLLYTSSFPSYFVIKVLAKYYGSDYEFHASTRNSKFYTDSDFELAESESCEQKNLKKQRTSTPIINFLNLESWIFEVSKWVLPSLVPDVVRQDSESEARDPVICRSERSLKSEANELLPRFCRPQTAAIFFSITLTSGAVVRFQKMSNLFRIFFRTKEGTTNNITF